MISSIGYPPFTIMIFLLLAGGMLTLDFTIHAVAKKVTLTSAVKWTVFYITAALGFAGFLFLEHGQESASLFLTGYTLEKVLAFDNLFVFSLIFAYFKIPESRQHSALHWGIAGAIVFRLLFVVLGVSAMDAIGPFVEVIFAILILLSVGMIINASDDEPVNYDNAWYTRAIRKIYPKASVFFIAICVLEISDILFSFDSVPAIIAITKDPLLIYSSMIFAILGLRSMYFIIAALSRFFVYMDQAVICVLVFIAAKLLGGALFDVHLNPNFSLAIILATLTIGGLASVLKKEDKNESDYDH